MRRKNLTSQPMRLFRLLEALPVEGRSHGKGPTELAAFMASEFGIRDYLDGDGVAKGTGSKRLQRDLLELDKLFGPSLVVKDASQRNRPLYWKAYAVPLPVTDAHAALAVKVADDYLRRMLPPATYEHLSHRFQLSERILLHLTGIADWHSKIQVLPQGLPLLPPRVNKSRESVIQQALFEDRQLRLRYRKKWDSDATEYPILHPAGLILRGQISYLVAFKKGDPYPRQFAMHRVEQAERLPERANIPESFSLRDYVANGEPGFRVRRDTISIRLRMDKRAAEHLRETPLAENQAITPDRSKDFVRLTAELPWTQELEWWLLGMGASTVVLAPRSLRNRIQRMHASALTAYRAQNLGGKLKNDPGRVGVKAKLQLME